jgi:hypothetical protein
VSSVVKSCHRGWRDTGDVYEKRRLSPLEFRNQQIVMKEHIKNEYQTLCGPESFSNKLAVAHKKLAEVKLSAEDEKGCREALDACDKQGLAWKQFLIRTLVQPDIENFEITLENLVAESKSCSESCRRMLDAVNYVSSQTYLRNKIADKLIIGGYSQTFAKQLVPFLEQGLEPTMDPESFDATKVTAWTKEHTIGKQLQAVMCEIAPEVGMSKILRRLKQVMVEHPKCGGAMIKLRRKAATTQLPGHMEPKLLDHGGSGPWVSAAKANTFRCGPDAWALPGIGAFVTNASEVPMKIISLPVDEIISKGICLPDVASFLGTPSGSQLFAQFAKIVRLEASDWAWIPYGYIAFPLSQGAVSFIGTDGENLEGRDDEQKGMEGVKNYMDDGTNVGFVWIHNVFSDRLRAGLSDLAWKAICSWNMDHLSKKKHQRAWTGRATMFELFSRSREEGSFTH